MAFSTASDARRGARVCTDIVRFKSGRVSRPLFPILLDSRESESRDNACTRGSRFQLVSPLILARDTTQAYPEKHFSTDQRLVDFISREIGALARISPRRSFIVNCNNVRKFLAKFDRIEQRKKEGGENGKEWWWFGER